MLNENCYNFGMSQNPSPDLPCLINDVLILLGEETHLAAAREILKR